MVMIATVLVALLVILAVALSTLAERKVMGAMQRRIGPKKVGVMGILQPLADGVKLVLKESVVPLSSTFWLFRFTPYLGFCLALVNWLVLPLDTGLALSELPAAGLLILIAISELSIYSVILSGWSANSKYPLLGSLRSTAQMISYSITLSLVILSAATVLGTINLLDFMIDHYLVLPLLPLAILFAVSAVAETNRAPFDLPEAESELVAGFFTEHSAVTFASFFLAEFTNILAISTLATVLFFGLSIPWFLPFLIFILWLRASLARLRFDQLLDLGWKSFLPFIIAYFIFLISFLFTSI